MPPSWVIRCWVDEDGPHPLGGILVLRCGYPIIETRGATPGLLAIC